MLCEDPSCWTLGEKYFDDLYEAIGDEPGLLFWDISNEPGYRTEATWYEGEPAHQREFVQEPSDMAEFKRRQELGRLHWVRNTGSRSLTTKPAACAGRILTT